MSKIIDEKGRIFGKINIIDLMVLLVIIAIIAAICFRIFSKNQNADGTSPLQGKQEVHLTLQAQLVVPEAIDQLKVGDKLVANNSFTTAEIVSIDYKKADHVTADQNGDVHLKEHPLWYDLTVVVKDEVNPSSPTLKIGGQEARVNYTFILKTQQFESSAKVRGIEFIDSSN